VPLGTTDTALMDWVKQVELLVHRDGPSETRRGWGASGLVASDRAAPLVVAGAEPRGGRRERVASPPASPPASNPIALSPRAESVRPAAWTSARFSFFL